MPLYIGAFQPLRLPVFFLMLSFAILMIFGFTSTPANASGPSLGSQQFSPHERNRQMQLRNQQRQREMHENSRSRMGSIEQQGHDRAARHRQPEHIQGTRSAENHASQMQDRANHPEQYDLTGSDNSTNDPYGEAPTAGNEGQAAQPQPHDIEGTRSAENHASQLEDRQNNPQNYELLPTDTRNGGGSADRSSTGTNESSRSNGSTHSPAAQQEQSPAQYETLPANQPQQEQGSPEPSSTRTGSGADQNQGASGGAAFPAGTTSCPGPLQGLSDSQVRERALAAGFNGEAADQFVSLCAEQSSQTTQSQRGAEQSGQQSTQNQPVESMGTIDYLQQQNACHPRVDGKTAAEITFELGRENANARDRSRVIAQCSSCTAPSWAGLSTRELVQRIENAVNEGTATSIRSTADADRALETCASDFAPETRGYFTSERSDLFDREGEQQYTSMGRAQQNQGERFNPQSCEFGERPAPELFALINDKYGIGRSGRAGEVSFEDYRAHAVSCSICPWEQIAGAPANDIFRTAINQGFNSSDAMTAVNACASSTEVSQSLIEDVQSREAPSQARNEANQSAQPSSSETNERSRSQGNSNGPSGFLDPAFSSDPSAAKACVRSVGSMSNDNSRARSMATNAIHRELSQDGSSVSETGFRRVAGDYENHHGGRYYCVKVRYNG